MNEKGLDDVKKNHHLIFKSNHMRKVYMDNYSRYTLLDFICQHMCIQVRDGNNSEYLLISREHIYYMCTSTTWKGYFLTYDKICNIYDFSLIDFFLQWSLIYGWKNNNQLNKYIYIQNVRKIKFIMILLSHDFQLYIVIH